MKLRSLRYLQSPGQNKDHTATYKCYVAQGSGIALISLPDIETLGLVNVPYK